MDNKNIEHKGRVVANENGIVSVSMIAESACEACKAKSACGMSEQAEKIVEVFTENADMYVLNEQVMVSITQSMGMKAVFFVYILPFILVFATLVGLLQNGISEAAAGGISLGVLVFYYFFLYLLRKKIENQISFRIEKVN